MQKGLVPEEKAIRVKNYINNINYEVGMIAHSCGVEEPRMLMRHHARIVMANSKSVPLSELYPTVKRDAQ